MKSFSVFEEEKNSFIVIGAILLLSYLCAAGSVHGDPMRDTMIDWHNRANLHVPKGNFIIGGGWRIFSIIQDPIV